MLKNYSLPVQTYSIKEAAIKNFAIFTGKQLC